MLTKDLGLAELLLERKADVDLEVKGGKTALSMTSDIRIAGLLIESGAKDTMLLAAGRGDQEAVRKFLDEMEHTPVPVSKAKPQP